MIDNWIAIYHSDEMHKQGMVNQSTKLARASNCKCSFWNAGSADHYLGSWQRKCCTHTKVLNQEALYLLPVSSCQQSCRGNILRSPFRPVSRLGEKMRNHHKNLKIAWSKLLPAVWAWHSSLEFHFSPAKDKVEVKGGRQSLYMWRTELLTQFFLC